MEDNDTNAAGHASETQTIIDWLQAESFCALPFVHTMIESNGDIRPCCVAGKLKDVNGRVLNVNDLSLTAILDHQAYRDLRQDFLQKKKNSLCDVCWKDPSVYSMRIKFSTHPSIRKDVIRFMRGEFDESSLRWLELKAGNRCNLRCRICGFYNSSQWLKDHWMTNPDQTRKLKDSPEWAYNQQCKWIEDTDLWSDNLAMQHLNMLHIMGGEPLMVPEHKRLLQTLIDNGQAAKVQIYYNTNATIVPDDELCALLDHFPRVHWSLSIDDIGKRFEYQRKNASWTSTEEVIAFFESQKHRTNWIMNIDPAISIFNIMYLDELLEYFLARDWHVQENHYVNHWFDARVTPLKAKFMIASKYAKSPYKEHPLIRESLLYLRDDKSTDELISERTRRISDIDRVRNESFAAVFPEIAELLGYE